MAGFKQGQATFTFGGIKVGQQYQTYRPIPKYLKNNPSVYWVPNRVTQMPRIDAQVMIDYFRENLNFGFYTEYVARMMLRKFSQVAAKYSPPNIGKANIDNKYYYRPIYKLEDLAKGLVRTERGRRVHATREDFAALRAGMKFKVVNTKYGTKKGTAYAYTKGITEAKRVSRIQNRGLTKYSWGSILQTFTTNNLRTLSRPTNFGILAQKRGGGTYQLERRTLIQTELPPIFKRLESKSPNIVKYRWGSVNWATNPSGTKIKFTIFNKMTEVERYCDIAIRQGINAAVKESNRLLGFIRDNTAQKIEKMFAFDIFKVTKLTALHMTTPNEVKKSKGRRRR